MNELPPQGPQPHLPQPHLPQPHLPELAGHGQPMYAEDHSGLRWPLVALGLVLPAAAVGLGAAGWIAGQLALTAIAAPLAGAGLFGLLLLWQNWPTGIRIYSDGISIGGMHRAEVRARRGARPSRMPPQVAAQQHQVFSCPWNSVQALTVISDPAVLRDLRRQARRSARRSAGLLVPLGFLQAPFMRSALLIQRVPGAGQGQRFRPSYGAVGQQVHGVPSPTWLVPTRHPEALRAALAQLPGLPPVTDHLGPDSPIQLG